MKNIKKNKHTGSDFQDFLEDQKIEDEVSARAAKRTFIHQIEQQMKKTKTNKNKIRKILGSPTTTSRVFDEKYTSLSLDTMSRAASAIGCELKLFIVPRKQAK